MKRTASGSSASAWLREDRAGSEGCTAHQVRRLSRTLVRLYDTHMEPTGMTIGQFSLLRALRAEPGTTGELALLIGADRTTLTRNLQPLLERAWVSKCPGEDARQRVLELTPLGLEHYRAGRAAWRRAQGAVEAAVGKATIVKFHQAANALGLQLEALLAHQGKAD